MRIILALSSYILPWWSLPLLWILSNPPPPPPQILATLHHFLQYLPAIDDNYFQIILIVGESRDKDILSFCSRNTKKYKMILILLNWVSYHLNDGWAILIKLQIIQDCLSRLIDILTREFLSSLIYTKYSVN